jgi:hypothetical protein
LFFNLIIEEINREALPLNMQFTYAFTPRIRHTDKIALIGSCFTEHISRRLEERKFSIIQNPHGILFNPVSVLASVRDAVHNVQYTEDSLFYLDEMWHSWLHHSQFSSPSKEECLQKINNSSANACQFLKSANWVIITLGSAFAYRHNELDMHVSNNHRAPAQWFTKELLEPSFILSTLQQCIGLLKEANPTVEIIFTISPVRHLRDGIIQNNRSKARLLESVHTLVESNSFCHYFPSYEIVIDELRDYRYYDIDFAHPNYLATEYVWQQFVKSSIDEADWKLLDSLHHINKAMQHKAVNPNSEAHAQFLLKNWEECIVLEKTFPHLHLENEKHFFSKK